MIAINGVYNFTGISLLAKPDYKTSLKFSSTAIDDKVVAIINSTAKTSIILYHNLL
jgi:hypothetical protein